MESGDTSDEEAPPSIPKGRELMRNAWLEVISMLVALKTEDSLKQGFDCQKTQHGMQHNLQTIGTCGVHACHRHNISPKLILQKKFQEAAYLSNRVHSGGCQESATKEETY